ncbi:LysR family transcriptional regulator [Ramlibacter sp. WS9]|uniref:LysR family transcriptional regulator n=1 Tax=Ramlibacter sp. WS9 TaxID=1882741 RepID=UPI001144DA0A|nr:LysR family transcriptional regulator [Ramlibacter sp. WS9]ROZ64871.1 LysR family transcriptional regulator [Ramlibacter sp. WS9]
MKTGIARSQYALTASDLELLLALVRGGTLAEAAERLAADASTVFRGVQRIEKSLGQRLFERTRQGYLASEATLEIARHAERIEAELEAARLATQGKDAEVTGRVRVTTTDSVLRGLVLPCLPALAAKHPLLQLELRSANELVSLTRRDADLALRATPKAPDHLVGRHFGAIRFVPCVARAMPAARRRKPLAEHDWIAPDEAMPDHPSVRWRRKHLPKLAPRHLVDGIVAVVDAVKAGLGVGIVPLFMLEAEPQLVALSEPLEGCESQLWLLAHPESRHLRRIAAVYQHFAQAIRLPDKLKR